MSLQPRLVVRTALVCLVWAALPGKARAADTSLQRAEALARTGLCTEALPLLEQARKADPASGRVPYVAGQCQIETRDYGAAVKSLERAKELGAPADTDLYLGMARFHAGDMAGAERALVDARASAAGRPELDFYEGLVLLSRAQAREAGVALERARLSGVERLGPSVSYYEGVAWQAANEREKARRALNRVVDTAPGTEWAAAAQRLLEGRGAEGDPSDASRVFLEGQEADRAVRGLQGDEPPRQWMSLTIGGEWDSNVVLRGIGVEPEDISNERDSRAVWSLEGGTTLFANEDWTLGFAGFYYGTVQGSLEDYNVQFPSLSTWLDRRLSDRDTLRLQYDFGYAWIGGDPYFAVQNLMPALYHDWGLLGTTRLFAQGTWASYFPDEEDVPGPDFVGGPCPDPFGLCGPVGLDEAHDRNRDGWGVAAGVDHAVFLNLPHLPTWLRAGYRYTYYWSRGTEYDHADHELRLGFRSELPYRFAFDAWGSFTTQGYRDPSTYPDPQTLVAGQPYTLSTSPRIDDSWQFQTVLERPITDWLLASVRYTWVQHHSNVNVYDYDRQIIGGFLTFRFAR